MERLRIFLPPHLKGKSEDCNKGSATERAWTEHPSLKNPEFIHLSHLRIEESRWTESTKIWTGAQRQPSSGGLAANLNLLRPSSFLLRRSPSSVQSVMRPHRLLIGLYDYQPWSVGLKMDVYMERLQESRSQSAVYCLSRSIEFEVTTSLQRNTVCTSVIVGYGAKMKRRLCVPVQHAGCYFSSPK